jgi:hypothetical protein
MSQSAPNSSHHRKIAWLVAVLSFLSFIYFYEGGGWNQNSRFDLLRAIIEQHTLEIDAYQANTQDKAHFEGHYYSEKAPGVVFLAIPFALAARPLLQAVGVDPESPSGLVALSYLVTACTIALPTAVAAVCLFFLALKFGADVGGATFAGVAMSLATPLWAYASLFWAHALVGACLIFAFAAALKLRDGHSVFHWALAIGLAAGWATVTEYPAAPISAVLAAFALWLVWQRGGAARWSAMAGIGVGAAICIVVLFAYLYAAFGSFRLSYSYYDPNSFAFMQQQGYLGLTYPHPDRLLKLLFGCSRGLFFASPILLAGPVGLWRISKEKRWSASAFVASITVAYYFLFNASFYWWKAGLTFGPRYAGASIPFLCLGLGVAWTRASLVWRRILLALALCSVFVTLMAVSTTSQLPMQESCPIVHSTWRAFWSGHMAMNGDSILTPAEAGGGHAAFNLGQLMGLHGLASLIPLIAVWIFAGLIWIRLHRAADMA